MALGAGILSGKKTYIVGIIGAISAIGAYLTGDLALADAAQAVLTAILGMTIRAGITAETK